MAKKYYAIKEGHTPGIYDNWTEAEAQVKGFKGAEYKSFKTLDDAQDYLGINGSAVQQEITSNPFDDIAYVSVDGSFNEDTNTYGYGYVIDYKGVRTEGFGGENQEELASMRQVAGEIIAAQLGLTRAIQTGATIIELHYDYKGIEHWATGTWSANKTYTQLYRDEMQALIRKYLGIVRFVKDAAHTGIEGNERADQLAKLGAGIG